MLTIPFLRNDALRRQPQDIQSAIAHEPKVGRRCYGDPRVKEGRILHGVSIEALGTELEHCGAGIMSFGDCKRLEGKRTSGWARLSIRAGLLRGIQLSIARLLTSN